MNYPQIEVKWNDEFEGTLTITGLPLNEVRQLASILKNAHYEDYEIQGRFRGLGLQLYGVLTRSQT